MIQRALLLRISQRVYERRQVRYRMRRTYTDVQSHQVWVGALVEEVIRATLLEFQEEVNSSTRQEHP